MMAMFGWLETLPLILPPGSLLTAQMAIVLSKAIFWSDEDTALAHDRLQ
jgi:hypothetical protein